VRVRALVQMVRPLVLARGLPWALQLLALLAGSKLVGLPSLAMMLRALLVAHGPWRMLPG
jgi:hypothetical protein